MPIDFHHGPTVLPEGGVRFQLYSPDARQVDLLIDGQPPIEMEDGGNGWKHVTVADAGHGTRYQFRIDGDDEKIVPDFGSRFQPEGIPGPSEVVDFSRLSEEAMFERPDWASVVIYQLHVGAFTPDGTYAGLEAKLDHIKNLGVNTIQLMPLHEIPGEQNWGYDIALPFAVKHNYGRPEDLKRFIEAAHARGLTVVGDVVYNHFGPSEIHTPRYAKGFTGGAANVWGNVPDFSDTGVRQYLIEHMMHMLVDYGFDGLRLDACHAITDPSDRHILDEAMKAVRSAFPPDNQPYLIQENDRNETRFLANGWNAVWAGDAHNAIRALWLGAKHHYYEDYAKDPVAIFADAFAAGYGYQGQVSTHQSEGKDKPVTRGEPSAHLDPKQFIWFFENHDQIGNSASAQRLMDKLSPAQAEQLTRLLMLAPHTPMFFMGQLEDSTTPFHYFTDWQGELAEGARKGRLNEYKDDPDFDGTGHNPNDIKTFQISKLDWREMSQPANRLGAISAADLLQLRQEKIVPLIRKSLRLAAHEVLSTKQGVAARWKTFDNQTLEILVNLSDKAIRIPAGWGHGVDVLSAGPERRDGWLLPNQNLFVIGKAAQLAA